jgi:hypothetical protein
LELIIIIIIIIIIHIFYASPNIIMVIAEEDEMGGNVARMQEIHTKCWKLEGKRLPGRTGSGWEYNLELILGKLDGKLWTGFVWLRRGTGDGLV